MDHQYTSYAITSRQSTLETRQWSDRLNSYLRDTFPTLNVVPPAQADLLIVLGGDGTLLDALRQEDGADILAFNTGHLGFLCTERRPDRFIQTLEACLRGDLVRMPIPIVEIRHHSAERSVCHRAINDILLERTMTWGTFHIDLLDGAQTHTLKVIRGSGLCICSPIGSTSPMAAHFQAPRLDPFLPAFYLKGQNDTIAPMNGLVVGTGDRRSLRVTLARVEANLGLPEDQRLTPALYIDGLYGGLVAEGDQLDISYAPQQRTLLRRQDELHHDRVRQLL